MLPQSTRQPCLCGCGQFPAQRKSLYARGHNMNRPPIPLLEFLSHRIEKTDLCHLWIGYRNEDGYGTVVIDGEWWLVHRLVWTETFGPIPDGIQILHHCDNPPCCRIDHLFAGTHQDNINDREAKNRGNPAKGEQRPQAKLTEAQVLEIKQRGVWRLGEKQELAAYLGIHPGTLTSILHGKLWKHVTLPSDQQDEIALIPTDRPHGSTTFLEPAPATCQPSQPVLPGLS